MIAAGLLARNLDAVPGQLIAYGRRMAITTGSEIIYTAEGRNSSVAIAKWSDGTVEIDVNGHVEATTIPFDMKLQRMVGHLPAMLHPNPKSVLGIGFGAGVSAGTFTRYPGIEKITVCEIEPIIPPTSTRYFAQQDYDVMHNPRTRIVYDDARHYMMTTRDMYDIIASDPLDVFAKGTAALYSQGVLRGGEAALESGRHVHAVRAAVRERHADGEERTGHVFRRFPTARSGPTRATGQGYDMVFMGQDGPLKIDLDQVQQRLERPDHAPVAQSLREIGVPLADRFSGDLRRTGLRLCAVARKAPRSIATEICGCNTWPDGASIRVSRTRSTGRS